MKIKDFLGRFIFCLVIKQNHACLVLYEVESEGISVDQSEKRLPKECSITKIVHFCRSGPCYHIHVGYGYNFLLQEKMIK